MDIVQLGERAMMQEVWEGLCGGQASTGGVWERACFVNGGLTAVCGEICHDLFEGILMRRRE